ncbi:HAD hydrolase family protein [Bacillus sp. SD088]|uniref:HAD hydrolase family protein n=1 Tax=Bacillus sp. SD088 TaxID=2782012 RepID=UPI0028BEF9D6|nr:HAD hydrolase family protein [Bacillus sp. SD088]
MLQLDLHALFNYFFLKDCEKSGLFMAKGVPKEYAVRKLCLHRNISMSEVMAFGDDWNDIELFRACRFPIAMENAIPELKSAACSITKANDEDGVAHILEKLT